MTKRKIWFTSDLHFNHPNIIKYCQRPFKDVVEQDNYLIEKINELCSPNDILYHTGDFMFPSGGEDGERRDYEWYEEQIEPSIIHIKGNHDGNEIPTATNESILKIKTSNKPRARKERVMVIHDPAQIKLTDWTPRYIIGGHIHDKSRMFRFANFNFVNVGVDAWNYQPIQFKDVLRIIRNYDNFFSGKDDDGSKLLYMPVINERWIRKADGYSIRGEPEYGHWVVDERYV